MQHNPHLLHIRGTRVGILEGGRPSVGGAFATVRDYFWREDAPWLVLQLPDGRRSAAPAAWTGVPPQRLPDHPGPAPAPGSGPPSDGPPVPPPPLGPTDPAPSGGLTANALWALLPPAEREQLGLRLSRLVLKAACAPEPHLQEDA